MKRKATFAGWIGMGVALGLLAQPLFAIEVLTKDDFINNIVKKEQLVKVADNAIFLLDTSSSMNDKFADTDDPKIKVMKRELRGRNAWFPDIGHQVGIYTYTNWQENYPVQAYNRENVAAALDSVRDEGKGPTALASGLGKLEPILKTLPGRTAVFLFSDGEYTGPNPATIMRKLAKENDACFYVISTATPKREKALREDVASLNQCSRLIPLADFVNKPDYTTGALYDVKVTEQVETTTQKRITGLIINDINFPTNKTELAAEDKVDLDKLAGFMNVKPESYAVIAGYTDDVGTRDHNEGLSRRRAEMVAKYLKDAHGISDARMVLFWDGPNNPLVPTCPKAKRRTGVSRFASDCAIKPEAAAMQRPENDLSWFDPAQGRFMAPGVGTWYGGSVRQLEIRSCRMMAGLRTACGTSASINDRVAG